MKVFSVTTADGQDTVAVLNACMIDGEPKAAVRLGRNVPVIIDPELLHDLAEAMAFFSEEIARVVDEHLGAETADRDGDELEGAIE